VTADSGNVKAWDFLCSHVVLSNTLGLAMTANNPTLEEDIYPGMESVVLPDPTRRHPLSRGQVLNRLPKGEGKQPALVAEASVHTLLGFRDKRMFCEASEELWPPRTTTDLALRRSRLLDFVNFFRSRGEIARVQRIMLASQLVGTLSGLPT